MAVPKSKVSKQRRDKRRANWKLAAPAVTTCPKCGAYRLPHRRSKLLHVRTGNGPIFNPQPTGYMEYRTNLYSLRSNTDGLFFNFRSLSAVFGTGLFSVSNTCGIKSTSDDVVSCTR